MAFDESLLQRDYNLVKLSVLTSTQISNRTSAVVTNLRPENADEEKSALAKKTIVVLTAKSKAAPKLISIVEIVKRELASKNVKCFQYNALSSQHVRIPKGGEDAEAEGSGDGPEPMDAAIGGDETQKVPVMTVYLSTVPVRELKAAHGYVAARVLLVCSILA